MMSEDLHDSNNETPIDYGGILNIDSQICESEKEKESVEERMNKIPAEKVNLSIFYRIRYYVSEVYKAIKQGIADVNALTPQPTKAEKAWKIFEKVLTILAGIFSFKKL